MNIVICEKNNVKREILLVTYEFPMGSGETFLETEVKYLVQLFSTVWILPSRSFWSPNWFSSAQSMQRSLPDGCRLVVPEKESFFKNKFDIFLWFRLLRQLHLAPSKEVPVFGQLYLILYETIKAVLLAKVINALVEKIDRHLFAYSYWKSPAATSLALLKMQGVLNGFITRCHGGDIYYEVLKYPARPFDYFIANQCDTIIPISKNGVDYLIKKGFNSNKILLSRLGVSIPKSKASSSNDGVFRIVSCSNIIPIKRVDLIASALSRLKFPFIWTHFGDGSDIDKVKLIVGRFPLFGHAEFPGRIANSKVLLHYMEQPVDVFLNISTSEGVPVSIMEALAAGIPCIASDVGGTSELVNEKCGLLVNVEVTDIELAGLLESVVANQSLWFKKREEARQRATELCNAEENYYFFAKKLLSFSGVK